MSEIAQAIRELLDYERERNPAAYDLDPSKIDLDAVRQLTADNQLYCDARR